MRRQADAPFAIPYSKISSGPMGSFAPSFASNSTVPLSRHFRLCHWPSQYPPHPAPYRWCPSAELRISRLQRNLGFSLALAVSSSSIFLSITILYLLTGKHKTFYSSTSILGGTIPVAQRRACLLPFPLSSWGGPMAGPITIDTSTKVAFFLG